MTWPGIPAAVVLAVFAQSARAAPREVTRTDWAGFREQAGARALHGSIRVELASGKRIKTTFRQIDESALVVKNTRATRAWRTASGDAAIPKDQISSVRFTDKRGKGRLIGTLVGAGAGAGIGAAAATSIQVFEGPVIIVAPALCAVMGVGILVAGYYIGRALDHRGPEFVLENRAPAK